MDNNIVTRQQQVEMGLIPAPRNYVPAVRTPQVEIVPSNVTQFPQALPSGGVELRANYVADPESRAAAVALKSTQVTIMLAIATAAAMVMLGGWSFLLWLLVASLEWCASFAMLNVLDYRESPAYNARRTTDRMLDAMDREHIAQLRARYPEQDFD